MGCISKYKFTFLVPNVSYGYTVKGLNPGVGILLKYRENLSSSLIASEGFPCDYLDHPNTCWEALDNDYGNQAKPDNSKRGLFSKYSLFTYRFM